jgi:outer membrane protein assembly factor BamB
MQQNNRVRLLGSMLLLLGLVGMLTACSDPSCAVVAPIAPVVHILVDRETVYLNSQNGPYALQAPTGTQRWHEEQGSFAQGADEDMAYIFSGSKLNAVRVNDAVVLWQQPLHGATRCCRRSR